MLLAREAMREQSDDAEQKMKLRTSAALDATARKFWALMQVPAAPAAPRHDPLPHATPRCPPRPAALRLS